MRLEIANPDGLREPRPPKRDVVGIWCQRAVGLVDPHRRCALRAVLCSGLMRRHKRCLLWGSRIDHGRKRGGIVIHRMASAGFR